MNDMMEINSISSLNNEYVYFITSISPENRSLGITNILNNDFNAKNIFLFNYDMYSSIKKSNNYQQMLINLKNKGNIITYNMNPKYPMPFFRDMIRTLLKDIKNKESFMIYLDLTSFMKWHILVLLKLFEIYKLLNHIKLLYTEPIEYNINLSRQLSFGLKEIFPIPYYHGDYDFSKESLLVIFLGYEGNRSFSIYKNTDPDDCLLLIPKPAYHKNWEGRTEKMNKNIINLVGNNKIKFLHSRNPFVVKTQLKKILNNEIYEEYNHFINPIGTKPQTIGLFLYLLENQPKNTTLLNCAPLRYNEFYYSTGVGRRWLLPFTH